jgi:hypothetical protein
MKVLGEHTLGLTVKYSTLTLILCVTSPLDHDMNFLPYSAYYVA